MKSSNKGFLVVSLSLGFILILVSTIPNLRPAELYTSIEWGLDKDDKFYYGIYDNYTDIETNTLLEEYEILLENEVLKVDDLSIDEDLEDDLVLLSALKMGDDMLGINIPNEFDLYQLYNTFELLLNLIQGGNARETPRSFFAEPNALHVVSSQFYNFLLKYMSSLPPTDALTEPFNEAPVFNDLNEMLAFVNAFVDVDPADYMFNDVVLPNLPDYWYQNSTDKINNKIETFVNPYPQFGYSVNLSQNGLQTDANRLSFSLIDYNNMENDSYLYWYFNTTRVSWYYQFDSSVTDEVLFNYTMPFNFTYSSIHHEGENGIKLKVEGTNIYYYEDSQVWYPDDLIYLPSSTPNTWKLLGSLSEFNLDHMLKFSLGLGRNQYSLTVSDLADALFVKYPLTNYAIHENESLDLGDGGGFFYPINFYQYQVMQNGSSAKMDYFDNFDYTLQDITLFTNSLNTFRSPNIILDILGIGLSFYHFLILPSNFNFTLFKNLFYILDQVYVLMLNTTLSEEEKAQYDAHLLTVTETTEVLKVEFSPDLMKFLNRTISQALITDIVYMTGNTSYSFELSWDKVAHLFKEIKMKIVYEEIGIVRYSGIQLVSTSRSGDNYPSTIPSKYSLIPPDLINNMLGQYTWTIVGVVAGVVGGSVGLSILAEWLLRRRRK